MMNGTAAGEAEKLPALLTQTCPLGGSYMMNCQVAHYTANTWVDNKLNPSAQKLGQQSWDAIAENEKVLRTEQVTRSQSQMKGQAGNIVLKNVAQPSATLIAGDFRPLWMENELFLVRQLSGSNGMTSQGVWLDQQLLKNRLLALTKDLFPECDLVPTRPPVAWLRSNLSSGTQADAVDDPLALVSLPWRLQATETILAKSSEPSAAMSALRFAWIGLTVAFVAGSVLVWGLARLSERRAAFVSSVTHELRTPLTTFQLYTDLLANGMVRDEEKRQGYFDTLRREADRLGHLVENVLAFAKVERGSARGGMRMMSWGEFLPDIVERITSRLEASGLALEWNIDEKMLQREVRMDPAALEHILMNLADNAVKYAQPSVQSKVELNCKVDQKAWEISFRDYGPGIVAGERNHVFRAFHKSAQAAAHSKPGVGLGLALSRRLAKSICAELAYETANGGGACFVLRGGFYTSRRHFL